METVPPTSVQQPTRALLQRLSVENLADAQLSELRRAYNAVLPIQDERGYAYWAGIHGLPLPMYCQHGNILFLPWHRAYLYFFELALRDQVPDATLPWWDWTSTSSRTSGVPDAYGTEQVDGEANPLYSAPIPPAAQQDGQPGAETLRSPSTPDSLPIPEEVQGIIDTSPNFVDFSNRLEDVHNRIHVWVGGTMAEIPWAAYDPVFWAHHAMIDRLWRLWQLKNPEANLDRSLWGQALPPFPMTVADTLDVTALGYEYASSTTEIQGG